MPPPTEPVRLVQVGAGAMGRAWLRLIGRSTDVRLVGLADLDVDTARRSAADTGFTDVTVATTREVWISISVVAWRSVAEFDVAVSVAVRWGWRCVGLVFGVAGAEFFDDGFGAGLDLGVAFAAGPGAGQVAESEEDDAAEGFASGHRVFRCCGGPGGKRRRR